MTIRPTTSGGDAQGIGSEKAACLSISPSGRALGAGIALLRKMLVDTVLRGAI